MRRTIAWLKATTVAASALLGMPAKVIPAQEISAPALHSQPSPATPSFSVVSVKLSPDSEADDWGIGIRGRNFWAVHVNTNELLSWAYGINARQIEHAPEWFTTERFDVQGLPDACQQPSREQYRAMLQSALADRFALTFRSSQKVLPVYVLSVATGGLKVVRSADQTIKPSWGVHQGWLSIQSMTFEDVARVMQRTIFDRPVLDQTGLNDRYTFVLKWRPDETQFSQMRGLDVPQEAGTEDNEDIYTSARQQLGIKIESTRTLAPTMVIKTVSHPSPN
jgi:uncharacterized protein (TIGR03435 family)